MHCHLSYLEAGQGLVRHGRQPVCHHGEHVGLDEGHLEVDLVELGHHVPEHTDLPGGVSFITNYIISSHSVILTNRNKQYAAVKHHCEPNATVEENHKK